MAIQKLNAYTHASYHYSDGLRFVIWVFYKEVSKAMRNNFTLSSKPERACPGSHCTTPQTHSKRMSHSAASPATQHSCSYNLCPEVLFLKSSLNVSKKGSHAVEHIHSPCPLRVNQVPRSFQPSLCLSFMHFAALRSHDETTVRL